MNINVMEMAFNRVSILERKFFSVDGILFCYQGYPKGCVNRALHIDHKPLCHSPDQVSGTCEKVSSDLCSVVCYPFLLHYEPTSHELASL